MRLKTSKHLLHRACGFQQHPHSAQLPSLPITKIGLHAIGTCSFFERCLSVLASAMARAMQLCENCTVPYACTWRRSINQPLAMILALEESTGYSLPPPSILDRPESATFGSDFQTIRPSLPLIKDHKLFSCVYICMSCLEIPLWAKSILSNYHFITT